MKVRELKALLETYPEEFEVVVSSDSEGNSFSSLEDIDMGFYEKNGYEEEFSSWLEWEEDEDGERVDIMNPRARTLAESNAICLWP